MKIKEAFKKLEIYNELAQAAEEGKKAIYFSETLADCIWDGESFTDFSTFRKHVRKEYLKAVGDQILDSDAWEFNREITVDSVTGRQLRFGISLCEA